MAFQAKDPTQATIDANEAAQSKYAMDDRDDFHDVDRGFIVGIDRTLNDAGDVVFDKTHTDYITDDAPRPGSVEPSLWRQSQLIIRSGLYKVTDGLYQVRGSAGANLTIVDAPDGLVLIDVTDAVESSQQGLAVFREHVADKPVAAVIYTHTHFDHYAGIKGVVDEADVASGKIPIVAPGTIASFDKFATGENVIAGNAMSRRASWAFAVLLPQRKEGFVSGGIATSGNKNFTQSYISPTDPITTTGETRTLGGLTFEFMYTPDTEAPEEMHIWIPELNALTCGENANHTMHNTYKYIHDQSLRLANQGLTPIEAAEVIDLPPALGRRWFNRYYHGALHHNVRAVFSKELGFWDGDPASIWPLLPVDYAKRHVDLIGADKIMDEGRKAIEAADYRWAVQLLHHLVFAEPDNTEAKNLQADAYEQLGYQQEIPQWRGIFLTAAMELRQGVSTEGALATASPDMILAMPMELLFDFAAVHLIGDKAADLDVRINITVVDKDERWTMWVANGVMNARPTHATDVQLTVSGPKAALVGLLLAPAKAAQLLGSGALTTDGDTGALDTLAAVMDEFDPAFNLVTP